MPGKPSYEALEQRIIELEKVEKELVRAKAALKENEQFFKDVLTASSVGIAYTRDRKIIWANQAMEQLFGFENEQEYLGMDTANLFADPAEYERVGKTIFGQQTNQKLIDYDTTWIRKDGSRFEGNVRVNLIDVNDFSKGVITSIVDVTERRRAEELLRESEQRLSVHLQNTPVGAVAWDLDFRICEWNPAAEKIFGFTKAEAIGKNGKALVHPGDKKTLALVDDIFRSLLSHHGGRQVINENVTKTGETILCEWYNTALYDSAGRITGVASLVNDITNRKKTQDLLIQSEKMISVGGLAAGIAHEIKNPLAGMVQNVSVLSNRLTKQEIPANRKAAEKAGISMAALDRYMQDRNIPQILETVSETGLRVASIITDTLGFARKADADFQHHDPVEIMEKALKLAATDYNLMKHYEFKSIRIEKDYEDALPMILCEANTIQQVLLNILNNGAYAMHETRGEIPPGFVIRLSHEPGPGMVRMEIEDNGPGIDPAMKKKLFDPFFTTKPAGAGTGLGLSVSYFIITEHHHGTLEVISEPGQGANFIIRLPAGDRTCCSR